MAGFVRYDITNAQTLKSHSQQVLDKTAFDLGFDTARKSINIKIRFKKGASHRNWNNGKMMNSQALANMLVNGYRCRKPGHTRRTGVRVPPRPVFDNYLSLYSEEMRNIVIDTFNKYKGRSVKERCEIAGERIMYDFKRKIYQGSLGLADNQGQYLIRKMGAGLGDTPLVASKTLFEDLEVIV